MRRPCLKHRPSATIVAHPVRFARRGAAVHFLSWGDDTAQNGDHTVHTSQRACEPAITPERFPPDCSRHSALFRPHSRRLRLCAAAWIWVESVRCLPRSFNKSRARKRSSRSSNKRCSLPRSAAGLGIRSGPRNCRQRLPSLAPTDISSRCDCEPPSQPAGPRGVGRVVRPTVDYQQTR